MKRVIQQARGALDNIQPQAKALGAITLRITHLVELPKNLAVVLRRNADATVPHLDSRVTGMPRSTAGHQHRALVGVTHRIGHQIEQDALQQDRVTSHPGLGRPNPQAQPLAGRRVLHGMVDFLKHRVDRHGAQIHLNGTRVKFRDVQQTVQQVLQGAHRRIQVGHQMSGLSVVRQLPQARHKHAKRVGGLA